MDVIAVTSISVDNETTYPKGTLFEVEQAQGNRLLKLGAVRKPDTITKAKPRVVRKDSPEKQMLLGLGVLTPIQADNLLSAGYDSLEKIRATEKATLVAISSIGDATADKLLEAVKAPGE